PETAPAPRAGAVEPGTVKTGPPAATSKWETVKPLLDRAQTLVTEGDIRGAQKLVAEAMEIDPGEAEVWKAFKGIERDLLVDAETLLANGEVQRALRQFEFVIEKNPESAPGHYSKGRVLMQLKNYDEAVAALERAVTLNPGNARYRQALVQARNLQKASRALERQGQESLQQMLGEQPGKKRGQ
ncbi:MAG: tetratricopeptide repeat protein, partial [Candidatus Rokuibacteriota bacterium]